MRARLPTWKEKLWGRKKKTHTHTNNVPILLQLQRADRGTSGTDQSCNSVARANEGGPILIEDAAETETHADAPYGADQPDRAPDRCSTQLAATPVGAEEWHPPGGQHGALHAVGSTDPKALPKQQDAVDPCEAGPNEYRTARDDAQSPVAAPLPLAAGEGRQSGHALASPTCDEGGPSLRAATGTLPKSDMGLGLSESETTQSVSEQPGHKPRAKPEPSSQQRSGKRKEQTEREAVPADDTEEGDEALNPTQAGLATIVMEMTLRNSGNWCFANASVYSLLWTLLSLSTFDLGLFGTQRTAILKFLQTASTQTGDLSQEDFFCAVLRSWGREDVGQLIYSVSQQDAAEFIHVWLRQMQTTAFQMAWEKRMQVGADMLVMDFTHEAHTPISLKFDEQSTRFPTCTLQMLVNTWHQVDGMATALLQPSPCLCLHVDRCMFDSEMMVTKCQTSLQLGDCFFPVFEMGSMTFVHHEYTVIATMSHLGSDGSGHYRSALRIHQMVLGPATPVSWLITDDWRAPEAVWTPASWLLENITVVWLVRTDLLKLHYYKGTVPSTGNPMQDFLTLLAAHTT